MASTILYTPISPITHPISSTAHLHKPNIRGLLAELLPPEVQAVLMDDAAFLARFAAVHAIMSASDPCHRRDSARLTIPAPCSPSRTCVGASTTRSRAPLLPEGLSSFTRSSRSPILFAKKDSSFADSPSLLWKLAAVVLCEIVHHGGIGSGLPVSSLRLTSPTLMVGQPSHTDRERTSGIVWKYSYGDGCTQVINPLNHILRRMALIWAGPTRRQTPAARLHTWRWSGLRRVARSAD